MGVLGAIPLRCLLAGGSLVDDYARLLSLTIIYHVISIARRQALGKHSRTWFAHVSGPGQVLQLICRAGHCKCTPSATLSEVKCSTATSRYSYEVSRVQRYCVRSLLQHRNVGIFGCGDGKTRNAMRKHTRTSKRVAEVAFNRRAFWWPP